MMAANDLILCLLLWGAMGYIFHGDNRDNYFTFVVVTCFGTIWSIKRLDAFGDKSCKNTRTFRDGKVWENFSSTVGWSY